jgi:hypothetical protein
MFLRMQFVLKIFYGMWRRVVWQIVTNISEKRFAFILNCKNCGSMFLRNVGNNILD